MTDSMSITDILNGIGTYNKQKYEQTTLEVLFMMRSVFINLMEEHNITVEEDIKSGDFLNYFMNQWKKNLQSK
ncbi:hypothetical protein QKV95_gp007 [Poseidoniales virus YSH_150918]|uniref:Uncharacterized protein n=1 Tax=Poseidoniales virus YSH_150918 TaxID=3071324 RepID=A0A976UBN1_9CAUD|nr:hypothetical protein QKV95_gp007 [Yangshan Harbor Poseidoniales virus]UVF62481.1 hypothetical protein [Poseidoniales virus YSH_150918]